MLEFWDNGHEFLIFFAIINPLNFQVHLGMIFALVEEEGSLMNVTHKRY